MEKKSRLAAFVAVYLVFFCLGAIVGVVRVAMGYTSDLNDPAARGVVLAGMFLFALVYHKIEDTAWKLAIGFVEIGVAMVSNYYQLEKLASASTQQYAFDRLAFLAGGIILLSKGIKDVAKGQYL
jgi:hypothetical protein